jgi:O-methyltransferase involved in polyketide biosynthesis
MKEPIIPNESLHEIAGPTALMVAHRRTFTDIPYSQAIFTELEKLRQSQGVKFIPAELMTSKIAPQIEARYKLINRYIQESGVKQIFEIAAGFSPRGLNMTDNPDIEYVESDLLGMSSQKKVIVETLISKSIINNKPNLHLETANALDLGSLQTASSHLDPTKPIAIVNEGLLRYLNFDEKTKAAKNIHCLLEKFGGLWITPDITLKRAVVAENITTNGQIDKVHKLNKINIDFNCFESVNDAQRFFENLGFTVERHSFMEAIDELASPQRLGQSKGEVEALFKDPVVFVMRNI